jgi:hypothetical protein
MLKKSTLSVRALAAFAAMGLISMTVGVVHTRADDRRASHADCQASPYPSICNNMIDQLVGELNAFNAVLRSPDARELTAFYHPQAVLYVGSLGRFYVGREDILNNYFVPLAAAFASGSIDFTALHFSVTDFNTIVVYGSPTATGFFKNGAPFSQPPLPQSLVLVRNTSYDPVHPFLIVSDHE